MTCREFIDFIAAYLDGELDENTRRVFEAHLNICPECVDYLSSYNATLKLESEISGSSSADQIEELPAGLLDAVLTALEPGEDE